MSNKSNKSTVTVASAIKLSTAAKTAETALLPLVLGFGERAAVAASNSMAAVTIIGVLFAKSKDFAADVQALFGNGVKGKAAVAGQLMIDAKSKAEAAKIALPPSAYDFNSKCRTVAANWSAPGVKDAAEKSGLRAGYDAAKPKAAKIAEVNPEGVPAVKPETNAEVIARIVKTDGIAAVLGMIESYCTATANPIPGAVIHEARAKLAA